MYTSSDIKECVIESLIFDDKEEATKRGLCSFYKHSINQFRLPSGFLIDILTFEQRGNVLYFKIIELKRGTITFQALEQISKYFYEFVLGVIGNFENIVYDLVLVGDDINDELSIFGYNLKNVKIYTYSLDIRGLRFSLWNNDETISSSFSNNFNKIKNLPEPPEKSELSKSLNNILF